MGLSYHPLGSEDSQNESSSSSSEEDDDNDEVTSDIKQPATVPPASSNSKYSDLSSMLVWSYYIIAPDWLFCGYLSSTTCIILKMGWFSLEKLHCYGEINL